MMNNNTLAEAKCKIQNSFSILFAFDLNTWQGVTPLFLLSLHADTKNKDFAITFCNFVPLNSHYSEFLISIN